MQALFQDEFGCCYITFIDDYGVVEMEVFVFSDPEWDVLNGCF